MIKQRYFLLYNVSMAKILWIWKTNDVTALLLSMIIDSEPIYFEYITEIG